MESQEIYSIPKEVLTDSGRQNFFKSTWMMLIGVVAVLVMFIMDVVDTWKTNGIFGFIFVFVMLVIAYAIVMAAVVFAFEFWPLSIVIAVVITALMWWMAGWIAGVAFGMVMAIAVVSSYYGSKVEYLSRLTGSCLPSV